jgi:deoxyribonuclease IV
MKLGAHMPTIGGVDKALERGAETGCEVVQIFVKNNMQWLGKKPEPSVVERFAQFQIRHSFACVFGHAGYLINLGAPSSPNRDKSIESLIQEIEIATVLNLPFLVLHPGAHLGQGEEAGFQKIAEGLNEVICATRTSSVRIALEITAGQGTCLGYRFSHLQKIYETTESPARLAICLDSAHLFAAGYDIRTPDGWAKTIREADETVGSKEILAIHLNDSKVDLNSRVDRHAGIGQGKIGREAFRHIINDAHFRKTPGCLETPKSPDLHEDVENLAILRGMEKPTTTTRRSTRCD